MFNIKTIQGLISSLQYYWSLQGCFITQQLNIEIGAGTFHPITYFSPFKKEVSFAYLQSCRRPLDGRYGNNTNKLQQYYQFQVIMKPFPNNIQEIYLNSLRFLSLNFSDNDIKFIEDNWENPTLGASGVGWEIWLNGIEITQFTYFQNISGFKCKPVIIEITYGLERLAMSIQNTENVYELIWSKNNLGKKITYGEIHKEYEIESSKYNFEYANKKFLIKSFNNHRKEAKYLLKIKPPLPLQAYEHSLKSIHFFNLLESRKFISIFEKKIFINKIRKLNINITKSYIKNNLNTNE